MVLIHDNIEITLDSDNSIIINLLNKQSYFTVELGDRTFKSTRFTFNKNIIKEYWNVYKDENIFQLFLTEKDMNIHISIIFNKYKKYSDELLYYFSEINWYNNEKLINIFQVIGLNVVMLKMDLSIFDTNEKQLTFFEAHSEIMKKFFFKKRRYYELNLSLKNNTSKNIESGIMFRNFMIYFIVCLILILFLYKYMLKKGLAGGITYNIIKKKRLQ